MTKLGAILGKEKEAKSYLDWQEKKKEQVELAIKGLQMRPSQLSFNAMIANSAILRSPFGLRNVSLMQVSGHTLPPSSWEPR